MRFPVIVMPRASKAKGTGSASQRQGSIFIDGKGYWKWVEGVSGYQGCSKREN